MNEGQTDGPTQTNGQTGMQGDYSQTDRWMDQHSDGNVRYLAARWKEGRQKVNTESASQQ